MSLRALAQLLLAYALVLTVACLAMHEHASLRELPLAERRIVVSQWSKGELVSRSATSPGEPPPATSTAGAPTTTVHETITAEGPLSLDARTFPFALVAGRDGLSAHLDGKTAFVTVDDLLASQAYDHASTFLDPSLGLGTHRATVLALLSTRLAAPVADVEARAHVRRLRFERSLPGDTTTPASPRITGATLDRATLEASVHDAARYLARAVDDGGRYRYLVDATKDVALGGYSWPRHAGTTYFLAQSAALFDDAEVRFACLRAAARLRDDMMQSCGSQRCIADGPDADVGSAALALVAFTEIVRTGADPSYRRAAIDLALFLRSQQRPDGELMHEFDREKGQPVDVQRLYFTGEAALALSRVHRITNDPHDLDAASRALSRLSGRGWSFFGSRDYFSE
jgi:hypothetical protein